LQAPYHELQSSSDGVRWNHTSNVSLSRGALYLVSLSPSLNHGFNTENWYRLGEKTNELSLILKPFLFAVGGVYTGLFLGYLYLAYLAFSLRKVTRSRFALWFLLANGFLCGLVTILTSILLGVCWEQVISADLVLWVS
jgi:hypothetical protein